MSIVAMTAIARSEFSSVWKKASISSMNNAPTIAPGTLAIAMSRPSRAK